MIQDLEKLKEIYLAGDLDDEDRDDNLARITDWEDDLRKNEDFGNWQSSDVTRAIYRQAKETFKDLAMQLVTDRKLTDEKRFSIWAKQDAALWIISLIAKDTKAEIGQIMSDIRKALKAE